MGYMSCIGACVGCGTTFSFNPERVPSMRVSRHGGHWIPDVNGNREPICKPCVERFNIQRERAGLPLIVIVPGAYEAEEVP